MRKKEKKAKRKSGEEGEMEEKRKGKLGGRKKRKVWTEKGKGESRQGVAGGGGGRDASGEILELINVSPRGHGWAGGRVFGWAGGRVGELAR